MSEDESPQPKKSKGKDKGDDKKRSPVLLILLLVVGLAGGVGVSKVMGGSGAPEPEPPPEPGAMANLEAVNLNLAGGHFLKVAVSAQLTAEVAEGEAWVEAEGAKLNDATIKVFSGRPIDEIQSAEGRDALVADLEAMAAELTEGQVMKIYLKEYVSQ